MIKTSAAESSAENQSEFSRAVVVGGDVGFLGFQSNLPSIVVQTWRE